MSAVWCKENMKQLPELNNNRFPNLMPQASDHKEPEDNDCGLPENPIFSDYSKYLWRTRTRSGGIQSPGRSRENTDGPQKSKS